MSSEDMMQAINQLEQLYVMRMLHERLRQQLEDAERFQQRQPQSQQVSFRIIGGNNRSDEADSDAEEEEDSDHEDGAAFSAMRRLFNQRGSNQRSGGGGSGSGGSSRFIMDMLRLPQQLEELMMRRAIALSLTTVQPSTAPPPIEDSDKDELEQKCLNHRLLKELETQNITECPVCQEEFSSIIGRTLCQLPCSHYFCYHCISKWLESSRTCPVCRMEMIHVAELYQSPTKKKAAEEQRRVERLQAQATPRPSPTPPPPPPRQSVQEQPQPASGRRVAPAPAANGRLATPSNSTERPRAPILTVANPPPPSPPAEPNNSDDNEEDDDTTEEQQQLLQEIVQRREQRRTSTSSNAPTTTTAVRARASANAGAPSRSTTTANSATNRGAQFGRRASVSSTTPGAAAPAGNVTPPTQATTGTAPRPAPGARLTVGRPRASAAAPAGNTTTQNNEVTTGGVRSLLNRSRNGR